MVQNRRGFLYRSSLWKGYRSRKANNDVILHNATEEDFKNIWAEYFDLYRDYSEIKNILSKDEILAKSVEFGHGIRLLKQDPFEIIVSFIISANNRIPMIKKL